MFLRDFLVSSHIDSKKQLLPYRVHDSVNHYQTSTNVAAFVLINQMPQAYCSHCLAVLPFVIWLPLQRICCLRIEYYFISVLLYTSNNSPLLQERITDSRAISSQNFGLVLFVELPRAVEFMFLQLLNCDTRLIVLYFTDFGIASLY